jgi:hypothetical protein
VDRDLAIRSHYVGEDARAPKECLRFDHLDDPEVGGHRHRRDDAAARLSSRYRLRDVELTLLEAVPVGDAHQHIIDLVVRRTGGSVVDA